MEEFAGVSGVWTTGGCEEESAGAVEVVNFSFLFFLVFFLVMGDDFFGFLMREGGVGWLGRFFFFLGREGGRKGVVDIYPFE